MGQWELRVRVVVDQYFGTVVLGLAILALLGGFVTYSAYGQTTERTETTVTTEIDWESTGQFTHQATVINDTRVFSEGTTLRNRSAYFREITPTLNGTFSYSYTASNGSLSADTSVRRIIRSVADDEGDGTSEYWRIEETLNGTSETLQPGERLRVAFDQNVTALTAEIDRIQTQLGTTAGTTETVFVATVQLEGQRNGRPVQRNQTYRLPLTTGNNLYRVTDDGPVTDQGERRLSEQETVVVPPGPLWKYGGPLFLLVGFGSLVGIAVGRYVDWFETSDRERDYLDYLLDRNEFEEWLTEGRFPADRFAETDTHVETTTLSGLVDLAIDTDRRVIETPDRDRYLVFDGDVVYSYEPPTPRTDPADPLGPSETDPVPDDGTSRDETEEIDTGGEETDQSSVTD